MNQVELIGRLTRDPELRYSTGPNQIAVCRFSLAINSGFGENKRTDYPNIVVFGRIAENCEKYLSKGSLIAVVGRIQTGSYTNRDGNKVYTTEVVASSTQFLSTSKNQNNIAGDMHEQSAPEAESGMPSGFTSMEDDDIPF